MGHPLKPTRFPITCLAALLTVALLVACPLREKSVKPVNVPDTIMVFGSGDSLAITVHLKGDSLWTFLPGRTVCLPQRPAASGIRFEDRTALFWMKGAEALFQTPGEKPVSLVSRPDLAVWERAKLQGWDFRAVGQEPPWELLIGKGRGILLWQGYERRRLEWAYVEPEIQQNVGVTRYRPESNVQIELTSAACRDLMSGAGFNTKVSLEIEGKELLGCGQPLH